MKKRVTSITDSLVNRNALLWCVVLFAALFPIVAEARQTSPDSEPWSDPTLLYDLPCTFPCTNEPKTVATHALADQTGRVHLFWHSDDTVFYTSVLDGQVQPANDILVGIGLPMGVEIDSLGMIHVVARGEAQGCVAYMQANASSASDPRSWSKPFCVAEMGATAPDLAIDGNDTVYVVYSERGQTGIALTSSSDQGQTWLGPIPIATVSDRGVFVGVPRVAVDDEGRIHAVWSELQAPDGYPPQRLLYAQSTDGGFTWSPPFELAGARQSEASLAVHEDTVHVIWNGDVSVQERFYRSSQDGGLTWGERETIPATGGNAPGLQGPPAIAVDANGVVHTLISRGRLLAYITRTDNAWSTPLWIAGPENVESTPNGELNHPSLAISEGQSLHAIYSRDLQAAYYQRRGIAAPYQAPVAWPERIVATPSLDTELVAGTTEVEEIAPSVEVPAAVLPTDAQSPPDSASPVPVLLVGVLPAVLLVLAVVVFQQRRRSKR